VTGANLKERIEHIMTDQPRATFTVWKRVLLATAAIAAIVGPIAIGMLNAPRLLAQSAAAGATTTAEVSRIEAPIADVRRVAHPDDLAAIKKRIDKGIDDLHRAAVELRSAEHVSQVAQGSQDSQGSSVKPPAFDVTSVKPNNSGSGQIMMLPAPGGGWRSTNVTLGMLVRIAYQLQDNQIVGGPKWLFEDRFDVLGTGSAPGRDGALFQKLQALLADRFSLTTHAEQQGLPMFALELARRDGKLGPKLTPSTADCPKPPPPGARGNPPPGPMSPAQMQRCGISIGPGRLAGGNLSMAQLATALSRPVGRMVVDRTNLAGNFELTLEYAPDPNMAGRGDLPPLPPGAGPDRPASDGPSIFAALQEQLGLKLESTNGPVDVLVIDRAEKPTPD
jgi:uncharacterized protein (TIGR03435 family)